MDYDSWEIQVSDDIKRDSLWRMQAYRLALFLADISWHDTTRLMKDARTRGVADQLYRATGSISANLAEGYSRGTGRDRARFYEYALGSARETRDWYFKARHVLGDNVVEHRTSLMASVIRLLLKMVPQQRGTSLREASHSYGPGDDESLLNQVPLE